MAIALLAIAAAPSRATPRTCNPSGQLVGRTIVYCGHAKAKLSAFANTVFTSGSCRSTNVNGTPQFTLKIGARTQNARTNSGRPYFGLTVSGPLTSPSGGGVIAYWKGERWGGVGISFMGNAHGGSFVATGINGSKGQARGSYSC